MRPLSTHRLISASVVVAVLLALAALLAPRSTQRGDATYIDAPTESAHHSTRFIYADIFIDSAHSPLAAWQIEARFDGEPVGAESDETDGATTVRLVGVEGADRAAAPAFADPPHYDPEALAADAGADRIVIAAFSTLDAAALPTGRVRIARLHLHVEVVAGAAATPPNQLLTPRLHLVTAADANGNPINAAVSAVLGEAP